MNDLVQQMFLPGGVLFAPLIIGLLGSLSFGVIGSYVVVRRISYAAYGISHAILLGVGAALFISAHTGVQGLTPQAGALAAALLAAGLIGAATLRAQHRADSLVSAVTVVGMSGGLLLLARTPGYFEPMSYLFGDILLVSMADAVKIGILNLIVVFGGILGYRRLQMVCFDEEFARLRGINTGFWFLFLLSLTAATVVLMMNVVGLVLAIALLTLPVMTTLRFARRLWQVMLFSSLLCALCVLCGLAASYWVDLPSGPVIVLLSGAVYLLALCLPRR